MRQKCWSLYNKEDKLRVDELTLDQVQTIMLAIPAGRIDSWYACREGDLQWQRLAEVEEFYEEASEIKARAPLEEQSVTRTLTATGTETYIAPKARAAIKKVPISEAKTRVEKPPTLEAIARERRSARRFVKNLKFRMVNGGNKFESETLDVSMAGLSLKESLPADAPKSVRANLELEGKRVKVLCNRISDRSLKILEADRWDLLRQWLISR